ncbi:hypothetical protein B0T20DRAFT_222564 [Sordaria brevicollis]|uniref:RGS domain-containing protein n=1 Tax=Sordaria brevicollis TaxID=83679 RepID=A0AAE0PCQ1_SORBR|nr:hypothetical protein B0T20DRAFT_222564 [Sordaria brevicollis]
MFLPRLIQRADFSTAQAEVLGSEFGTRPDTKPEPRLDAVGIWWIVWGAIWTTAVVAGMVFLWLKRDLPTLRIRGLALSFAGITLLHLYWISVQLGYSIGPMAPEVAEFWIMSIWFPFGIALFQAGNSQFLYVARAQARYARPPSQMDSRFDEKNAQQQPQKLTFIARLRKMDYSKRMFAFVTIGMIVQLFVVIIIYMISRKFHPSFGIPGTEVYGTPMEIAIQQGRGWEWWPSLFWQFLWAWVIAPIILWKSRGIRDTHGWQLQTMACCIAGLPAAPMWLIALYVPEMAPVNRWFVPPQWIGLSIIFMEIFTIFVPCWQVRKHNNLRQETLESIATWESKKLRARNDDSNAERRGSDNSGPALSPTSTKVGEHHFTSGVRDSWKKLSKMEMGNATQPDLNNPTDDSVLTMSALEHVLEKNPEPLRQFSARRDFSGENIAFLTAVAEWKAALPPPFVRNRHNAEPDVVRQQFTKALRIYAEFISTRDAEFPINIAWHELRKLEGIFERAARNMYGDINRGGATPFAEVNWSGSNKPTNDSEVNIVSKSDSLAVSMTPMGEFKSAETLPLDDPPPTAHATHPRNAALYYSGDIPQTFDAAVFDAAQSSIKYLVLTNTWPKYVRERRDSGDSFISQDETVRSRKSLHKALGFLKPLIRA